MFEQLQAAQIATGGVDFGLDQVGGDGDALAAAQAAAVGRLGDVAGAGGRGIAIARGCAGLLCHGRLGDGFRRKVFLP
ncbi:hypothetical protein D3C71_2097230 [compost metagenome]